MSFLIDLTEASLASLDPLDLRRVAVHGREMARDWGTHFTAEDLVMAQGQLVAHRPKAAVHFEATYAFRDGGGLFQNRCETVVRAYRIRVGGVEQRVESSCVINAAKKFSAREQLTKGTRIQVFDNKHRAWVGFRVEKHPRVLTRLGVVADA